MKTYSNTTTLCLNSKSWMIVDVDFFDVEKLTFLDFVVMYRMTFDINSKYLLRID